MRSAEFRLVAPDTPLSEAERDSAGPLKQQVSERLAAHRSRRDRGSAPAPVAPERSPADSRANRIAAAVAERYARSQSYRDYLAAEAQRAIDEANAAAELAARNAHAVHVAQQQLLADLDQWAAAETEAQIATQAAAQLEASIEAKITAQTAAQTEAQAELSLLEAPIALSPVLVPTPAPAPLPGPVLAPVRSRRQVTEPLPTASRPLPSDQAAALTVRLYGDLARDAGTIVAARPALTSPPLHLQDPFDEAEHMALDEEIEFRQTPVFEEPSTPSVPLPANLIEFPRQLVASRRARPRLAEGPLRDEADAAPAAAQLRIFEVETTQISSTPAFESALPEWSSICLENMPAPTIEADETPFLLPPQPAALNLRLMAAAVDASLLAGSFFAFVATVALTAGRLPTGPTAAIASAGVLLLLFLLYRTLFFTLSEATPGMRYARIALCTFSDENPNRSAMRRRTWSLLLSACPLGIGFLWACLDDDRLGWHDRISRMYQRSY
ncbi:MAG TPA: RDD family protein [Granulicella sp.]|nr:RDD family protein [Granulicella sp.]